MAKPFWVLCGALLLLVLPAQRGWAALQPCFSFESSAWNASDIVLVELHAKSAMVEVEESWRGSLAKGAVIEVEGLLWPVDSRAVLFLKHPVAKPGDHSSDRWVGADMGSTIATSMVWMAGDRLDAVLPYTGLPVGEDAEFLGLTQDGDIVPAGRLWGIDKLTLAGLKQATLKIVAAQDALLETLAIPDAAARIEALEPLVHPKFVYQRFEAEAALGKLGPEAVPALKKMLHQPHRDNWQLACALVKAAGPQAATEMTPELDEQLAFWTEAAPTLPKGWRENYAEAFDEARRHEYILAPALQAVRSARYAPARDVVERLRKVWVATPTLADREQGFGIIRQCDLTLQDIDEGPPPAAE